MFSAFVVILGTFICVVMLVFSLAVGFTFFIWPILFAEFLLLLAVFVMRQAVVSDDDDLERPTPWYMRGRAAEREQPTAWYARRDAGGNRPAAWSRPRGSLPQADDRPPRPSQLPDRAPYRTPGTEKPGARPEPSGQDAPRPRFGGELFRGTERFRERRAQPEREQPAPAARSEPQEEPSHQAPPRPSFGELFRGTERFRPTAPVPDGEDLRPSAPPAPPRPQRSQRPGYAGDLFRGTQRFRDTAPASERDDRD